MIGKIIKNVGAFILGIIVITALLNFVGLTWNDLFSMAERGINDIRMLIENVLPMIRR